MPPPTAVNAPKSATAAYTRAFTKRVTGFVREEKKFKSIEELQKQIEKDIQFVKNYDGV